MDLTTDPRRDLTRRSLDREGLRKAILGKLLYSVGKDPLSATRHDWFFAAALALRDRIVDNWLDTTRRVYGSKAKRVYYLSLEFLIGRLLADTLRNLGLYETAAEAMDDLGVPLDEVLATEPDAALGNGGLGRLAACFMDSLATLEIAGFGYGIRYAHGLFKQGFDDGWQVERPESWLAFGNPWEFERPEAVYPVRFFGQVREERGTEGRITRVWEGGVRVLAVAYDTPVVGWKGRHVNTLRLWSGRSSDLIDLDAFNRGDYMAAVEDQVMAESISRVLYPADANEAGQLLRLKQEYFFTSASLQDLIRRHLSYHASLDSLPDAVAIQLNDTHPAIAVPELMRLLCDEHAYEFDAAWAITRKVINYTNHTLMPEALERWAVPLLEHLLPRHMQLIYAINAKVLGELRGKPDNQDPYLTEISVIDESYGRWVRMGHLAFLGANKVNGVSTLHGDLMKTTVFRAMHRHYPDRITAVTNGVTPRRWILTANPGLATVLDEVLGQGWITDLDRLEGLRAHLDDKSLHEKLAVIRRDNKSKLSGIVARLAGPALDPDALFDIQIKRIHEYKRQLLNILEAIARWQDLKAGRLVDVPPRVKLFGGKAAPSYVRAKLIIKLINDVGRVLNADPETSDRLQVVYLPDYKVSLAERMVPAGDLSEQISTAGMEASGTGNMKFAMNGSLTIGTLDGANVEMRDAVGADEMVIFGLTAEEVAQLRRTGHDPRAMMAASPSLSAAIEAIASGVFSPDDPARFRSLVDDLTGYDHFLVTADFDAYRTAQAEVDRRWLDRAGWQRSSLANIAGMGRFSSDRSIREYADNIWNIPQHG